MDIGIAKPRYSMKYVNLLKGIAIIAIGFMWLGDFAINALHTVEKTDDNIMWLSTWLGWIIIGLCLWRGIVAIRNCNSNVTKFNLGIWSFLFIVTAGFTLLTLMTNSWLFR